MAVDQLSDDRRRPAATVSLRTLFLISTTCGVFFAVMRVSNGFLAATASLTFLWLWSLLTGRKERASNAAILAIVSVTLLAFVPIPSVTCGSGHRVQCMNHLKQIGLALLTYHQKYGSFPPAYVADANGKPLYSWRTLILPELDNNNLAQQLRRDEAWDGPNNGKFTKKGLNVFNCPSDHPSGGWPASMTSYVAVVGPHTAWSGSTPRKLSDFKNPAGTILVVEIANSGINWAEPRDLDIRQLPLTINPPSGQGISSEHSSGVNAVLVDGSVHELGTGLSPKTLAELLDLDGCADSTAF